MEKTPLIICPNCRLLFVVTCYFIEDCTDANNIQRQRFRELAYCPWCGDEFKYEDTSILPL